MKRSITIELDDETICCLAPLGEMSEVLAKLAHSAAEGMGRSGHAQRAQTDESLRVERSKTDVAIADSERARAESVLEDESPNTGAASEHERAEQRGYANDLLTSERKATDEDLIVERAHADTTMVDQREANEHMVSATLRAQELTVEADAAKERAEQSERELRTVAEFREMFIGILGHDLRNPLGAIVMAAALLLRRGHLDGHDSETVTRIIRSSQRMTRMIEQLLDLTRARLGGGLPIEPKPTDLAAVCRNVVEEFDLPIRLEIEGDVRGTWDQDRLAEVLSNLVGNAVEYAAPGTVVGVKAYADEAGVIVEVSNQGAPISADVLPFIFEPFRRATQQQKSEKGNLGLGLYIAKQIALSHGGRLDARSADGTTLFVMRLPRQTAQ